VTDPRGPEGFERYYGDLFGTRWPGLRTSLLSDSAHVELTDGLAHGYFLDRASRVVALALEVGHGNRVLDMCAAPGGKTLVLATALGGTGRLVANERSSARRARLHHVLDRCLNERDAAVVLVTSHDASRWGLHEPAAYDRVLADVPCSSERHVIQSGKALNQWSASRSKRLARGAYAIACAGADALGQSGVMIYSTCALSPLENDAVIRRLLNRRSGRVTVDPVDPHRFDPDLVWEQTELGYQALPDRNSGVGPMYFARLRR